MTLRPGVAAVGLASVLVGCGLTVWEPKLEPATSHLEPRGPKQGALKVHLANGELVVLDAWEELPDDAGLQGSGARFDARRAKTGTGPFTIPRDSIALLEINQRTVARPAGLTGLVVWTVLTGVTTATCVADPKSCFGSCPTFYQEDSADRPVAEGFSGSVARSLEATDVDHLITIDRPDSAFGLVMRNEALETHAVRSIRLLAAARPKNGRVFATRDGRYLAATDLREPTGCVVDGRDCLEQVRRYDRIERMSLADSTDLGAEETIELRFPARTAPAGLVIGARQSFLSTYLFYQTIAFTGRDAAQWLSTLERLGPSGISSAMTMMDRVGVIAIERRSGNGRWTPIGEFREPGPMAADVAVVPIGVSPVGERELVLRLRMAKGAWRVGYLALATLGDTVTPEALDPVRVIRDGVTDSLALVRLLDGDRYLVTYPGDRYRIEFRLPVGRSMDLFLESRGYYYEWMRPEWEVEGNPAMLALIGMAPDRALRRLAPDFKRREAELERTFWASRFGRN